MPEVVEFDSREDRLRAIDILLNAGETYGGVPLRRFLVSSTAISLLRAAGVRFRVLGRRAEAEEEPDAPRS